MYLVLREQALLTVFDDGPSGNDADKCILVIHYRHKVLAAGPLHQIVHTGGDPDRNIVLPAGNLNDSSCFSLAHIHITHIFQRPQKIAFC